MDLKALIAKMDQIESKKFLTESKDKGDMDRDGKNEPDPKEYKDNKDAAIKKAMGKKDKEVEESMINFKGAIAQTLLREFGLDDLAERVPLPVANPYAPDSPEGKLFPTLSPRDQEWLTRGGQQPAFADDPYIKARMPDKGKPVAAKPAAAPAIDAGATDMSMGAAGAANAADAAAGATDASLGAAGRANATPTATVGAVGADGTDAGAGGTGRGGAASVGAVGADGTDAGAGGTGRGGAASAGAVGADGTDAGAGGSSSSAPAAEPAKGGINPTVLNRYKELLDKLEGGSKTPAKPAAKPPVSGKPPSTKPAQPVSITGEPNQEVGGGTINSLGAAAESLEQLEDNRILSLIRGW